MLEENKYNYHMVDAKKGEIKTFEDLQKFAIEQGYRDSLAPKVRKLGDRVVQLRCQQQRDNPDLPKDMYGHDIKFYKELLYEINFGKLKDNPEQALKKVEGLGV